MQILFFATSDFTFISRHNHSWASFLLWPNHFLLSGAISNCPPVLPSSILDTFQPGQGGTSPSVMSFCLFVLSMVSSKKEHFSGLPFLPPVDHVLSKLPTITHLSWLALQGMAHSFTELCKPLHHGKATVYDDGKYVFYYTCNLINIYTCIPTLMRWRLMLIK